MNDAKYTPAPTEPPPSYETAAVTAGGPTPARPGPRPPLPLDLAALHEIRGKRIVLASASPRRKQLLAQLGLRDVEIVPSTFAENLSKSLSPFEYVLATATEKAMAVYAKEINNTEKGEPALLIAADTVVVGHFGEILEKPRNEREHVAMLKGLRDTGEHKVYTAVVCMAPLESAKDPGYVIETHVEETTVKFDNTVTDDLILAYVKTREGVDKAGGYGIQGIGAILIERIEGSFDNVVGLPLRPTLKLIEKVKRPEEDMEEDLLDVDEE
ncbi:Maf-domain-containing protein [Saccharata proteae CBS 121410]|uniref:Maf-domain-containing protein n=1 Tax=Saccharata proteae CBS 121410 TaxID=1314787 RepID=A0A9P4I1P7_9PEZI|nr:Maf-domain-containing protein [Saccharata proteae CBS 121410]